MEQGSMNALRIFEAAVRGASPVHGVRRFVQDLLLSPGTVTKYDKLMISGAGKASAQMACAAVELLQEQHALDSLEVTPGLVVTKYGHVDGHTRSFLEHHNVTVVEGGHPLPDKAGMAATERLLKLAVQNRSPETLVLNFISGGGSSLTCVPAESLTLADLQVTVNALLGCGATIEELNCVRKHLTRFQGGRFASMLYPAKVISFILSDVVGDPLSVIASGPTCGDETTFEDCKEILNRKEYNIKDRIPPSVWAFLHQDRETLDKLETIKPGHESLSNVENHIVANNAMALEAAKECALSLGYHPYILTSAMEGEARHVAKFFSGILKDVGKQGIVFEKVPACLLCGGETTVTLHSQGGIGGRNQELALAAALEIANHPNLTILAGGTDGQDGPCEKAGAIATGTLCASPDAREAAKTYLARNDSYTFYQSTVGNRKYHVETGPTGTNVMDILVGLVDEN